EGLHLPRLKWSVHVERTTRLKIWEGASPPPSPLALYYHNTRRRRRTVTARLLAKASAVFTADQRAGLELESDRRRAADARVGMPGSTHEAERFTTASMALPPAFHESLPYIDPEPSPAALDAARALISAEQQSSPPALPPPREPSFSPALTTELRRIASQTPLHPLSLSRYESQELPPQSSSETIRPVLSNAYVSAAYLASRNQNLALLDTHGAHAWLLSNYHLEESLKRVERELADVKREMDEVNARRAHRQEDVKAEMLMLEDTWRRGVGRVLETELAVEELKAQIREELKNRGAQEASSS
ncbi:Pre-mRNA-splicing factor SPF27, partial [Tolypocladium ophioglossoides CBS 100239]